MGERRREGNKRLRVETLMLLLLSSHLMRFNSKQPNIVCVTFRLIIIIIMMITVRPIGLLCKLFQTEVTPPNCFVSRGVHSNLKLNC